MILIAAPPPKKKIPQSPRQILQQLHIVLHDGRRHKVPPPSPAHRRPGGRRFRLFRRRRVLLGFLVVAELDVDRGEPYLPADRRGDKEFLYRGLRELHESNHVALLQGQHGD